MLVWTGSGVYYRPDNPVTRRAPRLMRRLGATGCAALLILYLYGLAVVVLAAIERGW